MPTVLIGVVGGIAVGLTSAGSGTLVIVCLLLCYPALFSRTLVGTDLAQAIPLISLAAERRRGRVIPERRAAGHPVPRRAPGRAAGP